MNFVSTLRDLGTCFAALECRWAVIGALAAGVHGVPRTTVDVDALIDGAFASRLDVALADLGYSVTFRWEESSHFASGRPDRCPLDFLHARRPHTMAMLARAETVDLVGPDMPIPVVQVEDLIGLKVQAMVNDPDRRRGELVDIRALLEAAAVRGARLDRRRVREFFVIFNEEHEFEELLKGLEDALA